MKKLIFILLLTTNLFIFGQDNNNQDNSANFKTRFDTLVIYYESKEYEKAILKSTQLIDDFKNSNLIDVYFIRALSFTKEKKIHLAIDDYKKLLILDIGNIDFMLEIGSLYGELGDFNDAYKYFKNILEIDSLNTHAYNNLSYYSNQNEEYNQALYYGEKALELSKDSIWIGTALNNIGYSHFKLNQLNKGLELINQSILYFPENSFAYRNRALISIQKNNFYDACKDLYLSQKYGGIEITEKLISKYCQ